MMQRGQMIKTYGHNDTFHNTSYVDVEVDKNGDVVACMVSVYDVTV